MLLKSTIILKENEVFLTINIKRFCYYYLEIRSKSRYIRLRNEFLCSFLSNWVLEVGFPKNLKEKYSFLSMDRTYHIFLFC